MKTVFFYTLLWQLNGKKIMFIRIIVWVNALRIGKVIKVEKILKGRLDLIPSPSSLVKIQITGGKVCLRSKGKT